MKLLIKTVSIVAAIAVLIQISFLKFNLGNAYYGILIAVFILFLISGKELRFNYLMAWFVLAGFFSIVFNEIPSFFRPYERFIAFVAVMGLTGPLLNNTALQPFRQILFKTINALLVAMVILSFFGIAAGLPGMVGRGGFAGLFNHSMMLGPMAAIAMLVSINWAYNTQERKKYWLYLSMAVFAFLTSVSAGSRSALLAGIAGGLFYYYKINQGKMTRFLKVIIVIISIGIFSFPLWESYTERLMDKMAYAEQEGDVLVTRAKIWQTRLKEFNSSPLIGVGFASVDTSSGAKFDKTEGRVEPGSSWLAVLSMVGLFGFVPFILIIAGYLKFVFKDKTNPTNSAFPGGLLFLFIVHMMAEGYVLSAGSGLFFYFWLVMGNIEIIRKQQHNNP